MKSSSKFYTLILNARLDYWRWNKTCRLLQNLEIMIPSPCLCQDSVRSRRNKRCKGHFGPRSCVAALSCKFCSEAGQNPVVKSHMQPWNTGLRSPMFRHTKISVLAIPILLQYQYSCWTSTVWNASILGISYFYILDVSHGCRLLMIQNLNDYCILLYKYCILLYI